MVDLEAFPAEPASDALRAAPGACHPITNPATLASDDRALAERLAGDLLPCGITLAQVPLTGQADVGPLRLTGGEPVLVDLGRRADRALAAIERARLGSGQRVVLALCDPQDVASALQALDAGADDFCLRSAPGWEVRTRLTRLVARRAPSADAAVLVVGGGDSAVEAAVAVAEVPGTTVTLTYRGEAFARVKPRNRERLDTLRKRGRLEVLLRTEVAQINTGRVRLTTGDGSQERAADAVIVCAGGELPVPLLRTIGVAFETKYGTA